MPEKYILNYSVADVQKVTENLTDIEQKKEKFILISINNYVRRNVIDEDILVYVSKQTGYFKSVIKQVLDKYESLGYIKKG